MTPAATIEQILDLGRWAPSGDNTQPWRFEVVDASHVVVHGFDTREYCVYDLDGHPSQISHGALLETIAIAASRHGLELESRRRLDTPETKPTFDLRFIPNPARRADPLVDFILRRSVQRRSMLTRSLVVAEKRALEASVGSKFQVRWIEGFAAKWQATLLMFRSAKLRLTMPEAYRVHRDVIEWGARFSSDRVPDKALGVDPMTAVLMRFVLQDWKRVRFFNKWLAGTLAPRLQMELIPGLACGAHFVMFATDPPRGIDDYVRVGRALQRFWLTATQLGLLIQPELTPLIFSRYAREKREFSATSGMTAGAQRVRAELDALIGSEDALRAVFMGRAGGGTAALSRSTRLELSQLMVDG